MAERLPDGGKKAAPPSKSGAARAPDVTPTSSLPRRGFDEPVQARTVTEPEEMAVKAARLGHSFSRVKVGPRPRSGLSESDSAATDASNRAGGPKNRVAPPNLATALQRRVRERPAAAPPQPGRHEPPVQRKPHEVYDNKTLSELENTAAWWLAKDLDGIALRAQERVDDGSAESDNAAKYLKKTHADPKQRGTAIHYEAYFLIGNQLKAFSQMASGDTETKIGQSKGRVDIYVKFPSGRIVVFDITTLKQAEKAHTSGRDYSTQKGVARVYEISYDD